MASIVDICNLALAHVGDEANVSSIDPPDGTTQATHCSRFFSIARDSLLERHAWSFAVKRQTLAQLTMPTTDAWDFQYQEPTDLVKALIVLPEDAVYSGRNDDYNYPFLRENSRILTNLPAASLRYIFRQIDPTRYSSLFIDALALALAAKLAGPIIKGREGRNVAKDLRQQAEIVIASAIAADSNSSSYRPEHVPDHLRARGVGLSQANRASRGGL